MATAKAPATSPLNIVQGEEEEKKFAEVRDLQNQLKEALDYRKGFYLDPTMLAIASGFAEPTLTGSFFESAGKAARRVGETQEAERKRAQEIAQMKMELAMSELSQIQQQRMAKETSEWLKGNVPAGAAGAPSGAPAGAPSGAAPTGAPAGALANSRPVTTETIEAIRLTNPRLAETMERIQKSNRDRFVVTQSGNILDKDTQQYLNVRVPGQEQKVYNTPYGRFSMLPYEHDELQAAIDRGEGQQWFSRWKSGAGKNVVSQGPDQKPSETPRTTGRLSAEEQAAKQKGEEVAAEKTAEAVVKRTQEAINGGSAASDRLPLYGSLEQFASDPDAKEIFGILATPKASSAILKLIRSKVQLPFGMSIEIPEIEDALRDVGIPPRLISKAQNAAALMAQAQLSASRAMQGQGAVSDFERRLFSTSSFSMSDRPETVIYKAQRFKAAAKADKEVADALLDTGMSLDQFRRGKDYERIKKEFDDEIRRIDAQFGGRGAAPAAAPKPAEAASGKPSSLRDKVENWRRP
jgi:hypothetical protein